jgi:hypothetical protein
MTSRVLATVAALLAAGAVAGCARTVPGTVAMTTEPGFSTSTSTPRSSPGGPGPAEAQTMTCQEFAALDEDAQSEVILEILGDLGPVIGDEDGERMRLAADALCQFMPGNIVLSELLLGGSPP